MNPIRKLKHRLGLAIQWRAQEAADRSAADLADSVHGLSHQLQSTLVGIADWRSRVSETFSEVARRLDEIDHRSKENSQVRQSVADLQRAVSSDLDDLQRVVSSDLDELRKRSEVLASQVRARPFTSELDPFRRDVAGLSTIGFVGGNEANYVDFADAFRPPEDDLIRQLSSYKQWFPTSGRSVDLGAGRGEMVEVMKSAGLDALGIDNDESMVSRAVANGRQVVLNDVDSFLVATSDGEFELISAIHIVEHVDTPHLMTWLGEIRRVLSPGGRLIIETPNPHAIDAFKAFWLDTTHVRPYYPESLLHMAHETGFSEAFIWAEGSSDTLDERLGIAGAYALIATA